MVEKLRIAGISDTHFGMVYNPDRPKRILFDYKDFRQHVRDMSDNADVIVHCGDFTDKGDEVNLRHTSDIFSEARIPVIGVLGNHDVTSGPSRAKEILTKEAGVTLLEGQPVTLNHEGTNVTFLGIPGFAQNEEDYVVAETGMTRAEYQGMASDQFSEFHKGLSSLRGKNNIIIFHFDPLKMPDTASKTFATDEPELTDLGRLVDRNAKKIKVMLHGHDHRFINRPITTPGNVDIIDLAAPIQIKMQAGVPYRLIEVPLSN